MIAPVPGAIFVTVKPSIITLQSGHHITPSAAGRSERLKSRKLIEQLFTTGKSFPVYPFRLYYIFGQNPEVPLQAGFGVSAKKFKRAVDRNRIKRLMREAYRLQKKTVLDSLATGGPGMAVFFIYTGKELPDFNLVSSKMALTLQRMSTIIHESSSTHT